MELCWLTVAKGLGLPPHMSPLVLTARHGPCRGGRDVMDVIGLTGGTPAGIFKGNERCRLVQKEAVNICGKCF